MARISIPYTTHSGSKKTSKFKTDSYDIDLRGKSIATIELAQLIQISEPFRLILEYNRLKSIDLTPLNKCKNLEELFLGHNELVEVDLRPLSRCLRLKEVEIHNNNLEDIDLQPLSHCRNLEGLWISSNYLTKVDLSPLSKCKRFASIDICDNRLESVNLDPLMDLPVFRNIILDPSVEIFVDQQALSKRLLRDNISQGDPDRRLIEFKRVVGSIRVTKKSEKDTSSKTVKDTPMPNKRDTRKMKYRVALSYAGEQLEYVQAVADSLKELGVHVFFDKFQETEMWGKDLNEILQRIYERSEYCVLFISKEYAEKHYPTHEKRSAMSDNVKVLEGRILPVRFDETELPGLPKSITYLSASKYSPDELASMIAKKIEL